MAVFTSVMIDNGHTELFILKGNERAVTLFRFVREFSGIVGFVAVHDKDNSGAAMECDIFGKCCVRDRQIKTDHPMAIAGEDAIRKFLEQTMKTGV